jgi:hypothetical protein
MKRAYVETAIGIGIAVALFLAGYFAAFFVDRPPASSGDTATWAGALGTLLAFGGTIWIATEEARRRHLEALWRARIAAPSMLMKISSLRAPVVQAIAILKAGTSDREVMAFCGGQISGSKIWSLAEIDHCAVNLALAKEVAEAVAEFLIHPTEDLGTLLSDGIIQLHGALHRIDAAKIELEAVYDGPEFAV